METHRCRCWYSIDFLELQRKPQKHDEADIKWRKHLDVITPLLKSIMQVAVKNAPPRLSQVHWNWATTTAQPIVPSPRAITAPALPPPEIPHADPKLLAHNTASDSAAMANLFKPQYDGTELGANRPLTNKLFESDMVLTVEQIKA
ncbi:unnamed protein product [Angiostrongylus costaricensis]|uniref:Uncharacterized protein n=1 Tax=Angiostrongylus costaricensis TaxID=334426 RepID=A0A0R3PI17_ANGCS|nr:unnamed protein product [Angiostrongylus costaricensis]